MVNPYVLIATHQRIEITERNIKSLLSQQTGIILVVSDSNEVEYFKSKFPMVVIVRYGNYPLGRKWQEGVSAAMKLKADPLIINGSDDILSKNFFDVSDGLIEKGYHFIGLKSWYVQWQGRVYHFRYDDFCLGSGRVYTRELLTKINYNVFDGVKHKHLDDCGWYRVQASQMKMALLEDPLVISVKGDWPVMNTMDKFFKSKTAKLVNEKVNIGEIGNQFDICVESLGPLE